MGSSSDKDSILDCNLLKMINILNELSSSSKIHTDLKLKEITSGILSVLLTLLKDNESAKLMCWLDTFKSLGKAAEEDIDKLVLAQERNKAVSSLNSPSSKKVSLKNLTQDKSRDEFEKLFSASCDQLQKLQEDVHKFQESYAYSIEVATNLGSFEFPCGEDENRCLQEELRNKEVECEQIQEEIMSATDLLKANLSNMMNKWRRYEALVHVEHIIPRVERKEDMRSLNNLFSEVFQLTSIKQLEVRNNKIKKMLTSVTSLVGKVNAHLSSLMSTIIPLAWCLDKQPSPCVKLNNTKLPDDIDLELRVFGFREDQILKREMKINYYFEKDPKTLHDCTVKEVTMKDTNDGLIISVTLQLAKFTRTTKRSTKTNFEHFNRITWQLKLDIPGQPEIKCLSLPFTVRSGSTQLWYYIGAVHWYCWVQTDLYQPKCQCPTTMKRELFLSMLQERYHSITSDHFTEENIQSFQSQLDAMPSHLSHDVQMNEILQGKLPCIRSSDNSKRHTQENKFSFYNWFIAACNTLKRFQLEVHKLRIFSSFLSQQHCNDILKDQPNGTAIVRLSLNSIKNIQSEAPLAFVTVQIIFNSVQTILVKDPDEIRSLYSFLSHIRGEKEEPNFCVHYVWPSCKQLEEYKECCTENVKSITNINGYKQVTREDQGDIIVSRDSHRGPVHVPGDKVEFEQPYELENENVNFKHPRLVAQNELVHQNSHPLTCQEPLPSAQYEDLSFVCPDPNTGLHSTEVLIDIDSFETQSTEQCLDMAVLERISCFGKYLKNDVAWHGFTQIDSNGWDVHHPPGGGQLSQDLDDIEVSDLLNSNSQLLNDRS
ncbi:uncharacterized protein LOC106055822 [Biomphalaria glabrata]|uniref:Uncharacterized protein LOC106055822 n=1 Tax=Biomphalaria glabrata TaxID=6526 RepID=A0A9W2YZT9_BIOGL|nr:uncharacterized protein LOC106055822 [Biomphalaria glabrata]XP_055868227.1 uncharacterized protein LOC106055822 [Biomphalaria glabrata]XP_055868228.1 uncharacterized protein LOC106055822 [Biomphalaria glabrata]XP_055868229.1 uncharacterized protein LOC106055822 [Biomphalaria glabrata]